MLIEMVDGGIIEVITDTDVEGGCETCDYGSEYINEFTIQLLSNTIEVKVNEMYEFALSEGYMMELFLKNVEVIKPMTEKDFSHWLKEKVLKEVDSESLQEFTCHSK